MEFKYAIRVINEATRSFINHMICLHHYCSTSSWLCPQTARLYPPPVYSRAYVWQLYLAINNGTTTTPFSILVNRIIHTGPTTGCLLPVDGHLVFQWYYPEVLETDCLLQWTYSGITQMYWKQIACYSEHTVVLPRSIGSRLLATVDIQWYYPEVLETDCLLEWTYSGITQKYWKQIAC
jgi:hypothetical protein